SRQAATLGPAFAADLEVAGQDGAGEGGRRDLAKPDAGNPHSSRAMAASRARRTCTVATWARYSRSAWMSAATVAPSVAWRSAWASDSPARTACSTAEARYGCSPTPVTPM